MRRVLLLGLLAPGLFVASFVACGNSSSYVEEIPPSSGGPSTTAGSTSSTEAGTSATPILAVVDANKTLTATPGNGVGIFIQYMTGGHWNVWWTCDTNKTGLNCACDIKGSIATGALANVTAQGGAEPTSTLKTTAASFEAVTTTTTAVDGVTFDAPLGSIVTLDASIGGLQDGSFFFFVQNGEVNGGYTGALSDPLELEAATP